MDTVSLMGSGSLGRELDLKALVRELEEEFGEDLDSDFQSSGTVTVRFGEDSPTYSIYRTGSFQIRGAGSQQELEEAVDRFIEILSEIELELSDIEFESRTAVYMEDLGQSLNLESLTVALGLEHTEYEPEQFPGLVYRSPQLESTLLIFATGKILIVGTTSGDIAKKSIDALRETLVNMPD